MSAPFIARQRVLCGQAASTLRLAHPSIGRINPSTSASIITRSFHAQSNRSPPTSPALASKRWPLKTLGGGLMAAGGGWCYLGNNDVYQKQSFSVYSPLESESGEAKQVNGSSTLLRPASPAAPRRQTVTLVFLTSQSTGQGLVKSLVSNLGGGSGEREKWFPWIGYFQEAGHDCLQMNLALPNNDNGAGADTTSREGVDKTTARLADELHSQIRLSNLQRQPVLFVHHAADSSPISTAQMVSSYIEPGKGGSSGGGGFLSKIFGGGGMFGSRPAISGLVVISDLDDASALTLFGKHPKLNTLIVANGGANTTAHQGKVTVMDAKGANNDKIIKDIECWLIKERYEG